MVTIDYLFDEDELKKLEGFTFEMLTGTDLDYSLFCGSIFLRVDGVSFDATWKWIPIFDFCVRINEVLLQLRSQGQAVLEFTENEATLVFTAEGSWVFLKAQYANAQARVQLQQLEDAIRHFSDKLIRDLIGRWPPLLRTEVFRERLEIVQSASGVIFTAVRS